MACQSVYRMAVIGRDQVYSILSHRCMACQWRGVAWAPWHRSLARPSKGNPSLCCCGGRWRTTVRVSICQESGIGIMDDPDQPSTEEKTRVPRDGERFFVHRSSESGSVIVYGSSSSCCHVTYF